MSATRISQLVKELEQIRRAHGDIEVWVQWSDPDKPARICYGERFTAIQAEHIPPDGPVCVLHTKPA